MKPTSILHEALDFAVSAHAGESRDGVTSLPYVTHVIDVLNKLRYVGRVRNEVQLVASLLHDILEETDCTRQVLAEKFGGEATSLVEELTRIEPDKADRDQYTEPEWYELRSSMLLEEIRVMRDQAQEVKLADRLSNVEGALVSKTGLKLERYLSQSRKILDIVPRARNPMLWDAIDSLLTANAMGLE